MKYAEKTSTFFITVICAFFIIYNAPAARAAETKISEETIMNAGEIINPNLANDERNIYIGDIIVIKIAARISREELADKFSDFEITEIVREPDGYTISVRTLTPGEHKIMIGDKEIIIDVRSTLDDFGRGDVIDGALIVLSPGFTFHFRLLFYVSLCVFIVSGAVFIVNFLRAKKIKKMSPRRLFMVRSGALSAYDGNFFVDLTFYFKEYLGSLYNRRIIGKTSAEIISELTSIDEIEPDLKEIEMWLIECDRMKFTGVKPSADEKNGHYSILVDLVKKIDETHNGVES